jgi:hypothetical protein
MYIGKVLFLDIDGTLNTFKTFLQVEMSPPLVQNLLRIVRTTDCKIVVSSAWRLSGIHETSDFQKELRKAFCGDDVGFNTIINSIIGMTDDIPEFTREQEILHWIRQMSILRSNISKFVAVDDQGCMFPSNPSWLVLTDPYVGLDDTIVDIVISKLS